jgi:hypothetical protein
VRFEHAEKAVMPKQQVTVSLRLGGTLLLGWLAYNRRVTRARV